MRLVRIFMSIIALTFGSFAIGLASADAASRCPKITGSGKVKYPPGQCKLKLRPSSAEAGDSVTAEGDGYGPGTPVNLTFDSVPVGTAAAAGGGGVGFSVPLVIGTVLVPVGTPTANSAGTFVQAFTVPAGTALGDHNVLATGVDANGEVFELSAILQVVASDDSGTGGNEKDISISSGTGTGTRTVIATNNGNASGPIPRTGTTPAAPLAAGLALTAAGAVLMVVARRRKLNLA